MQRWDFNRTIYAHNMGGTSEAMFSSLLHYKDEGYFMAHRQLYYTECYGTTAEYQVMAVVKYNAGDTGSWDFRTRNHTDMESYNLWMEGAGSSIYPACRCLSFYGNSSRRSPACLPHIFVCLLSLPALWFPHFFIDTEGHAGKSTG